MPLKDLNRKGPRKASTKKSSKVEVPKNSKNVDRKIPNKRIDKSKRKLVKPTKKVAVSGAGLAAILLIGTGTFAMHQGSDNRTEKTGKNQDLGISESHSISKITKSDGKTKKVKKDNNKLASVLNGESTNDDLKNLLDPTKQKKAIGSNFEGDSSPKTLSDVVKDVLGNKSDSDKKPENNSEQLATNGQPNKTDSLGVVKELQNNDNVSSKGDQLSISKPIPGSDGQSMSNADGEGAKGGNSSGIVTGGGIGGGTGEENEQGKPSTSAGDDKNHGSQTSNGTSADSAAQSQANSIAQSIADSQSVANSIASSNAASITESQQKSAEIAKSEAAMSEWANSYVNSITGAGKTNSQPNSSQGNVDIAKSITDSVNASYEAAHKIDQSVQTIQTNQYATIPTAESAVNSLESQAV
ncbi:hypothetical protein ESZ50_02480 [Weissella muntiaci]|uniref:Uncharacterized protein n=1 Tax=Weissella muntiaci TaxID=2508881 RepID=A0A6C2CBV2_9LACO|nr:hypothetical protein [Weissella muntiaci]TYC50555.1 hypothetical protein ESZ50_02480 [Weissella muntiaci]